MRKIHVEGPYAGKNKIILDREGRPASKEESNSAYIKSLRLTSEADAKATATDKDTDRHIKNVRDALNQRQEEDEKLFKERIKEKRIKSKKRLREEAGLPDKVEAVLGGDEYDSEEDGSQQSYDESEQSSDDSPAQWVPDESSSEPEPVKKRAPANKKTNETAEERAMKLLNKSLFD